jgi:glycosyltransferase involved in cell wall biosynthesis
VLGQTYQDFELIIVDDGSTDNTERLVKSFNSEKIGYIRQRENKGPGAARNTGIQQATGDYIAFQDSDDEWVPQKLEKQIRALETAPPEVGIVYTGWYEVINNKKEYFPPAGVKPKDGDLFSSLLRRNIVGTPMALVKRGCFEKAGMFDEALSPIEDWELFLRMSRHYQFKYIDEPLAIQYKQADSISKNQSTRIKAFGQMLEMYYEDIKQDNRILAYYYFRLGSYSCSNGELSQGRSYLIKSMKTHPLDIKTIGAFLASLFGRSVFNIVGDSYRRIFKPF